MALHDGHRQRLKDRFRSEGLDNFEERHVLELLLGYAIPRKDTAPLAEELLESGAGPYYVCLEQDMAKALGQAMAVRTGKEAAILCIDRIRVGEGTYLDIGAPVGPAMPVVVKTLILGK